MSIEITYFVHGTTYDNENKIAAGWNNSELTERGINETLIVKDKIKDFEFDLVISSDLKRTKDTTNILFKDRPIKITYDNRLRECNYGVFNGQDSKYVNYNERIFIPFPNGESLMDVEARIKDLINDLKNSFDNQKIAFVSHRAPQLALEVILNNKTWEKAIKEDWRNDGKWQLGWKYIIK